MNTNNGWLDIASAPKTGRTLLLGYWNSHGKWRTVRGQWMSADYIAEHWDEPDDAEAGWFETAVEADDAPNCWPVTPSHWQPLPVAPGSPASTVADEGAKDEQAAFEEWFERTCPSGDVESVQRQWEASSEYEDLHAEAPAAGDARDAITIPIAAARMIRREYLPSNPRRMSHVAVRGAVEQFLCALQSAEAAIAASQQGGE